MWYGLYETILNAKNLLITKVFYPKARLVRFPAYIRNKKHIEFGNGFTCGYNCRMESIQTKEYGYGKIVFGNNVKIGDNVHIASASKVEVGDNVLMASHIFITDLEHGKYSGECQTAPDSFPDLRTIHALDVKIGNNVWIGENVIVLKGVTIGDGSVIGSASVVTKDIPEHSIAVGSPAKVIKRYCGEKQEWISV